MISHSKLQRYTITPINSIFIVHDIQYIGWSHISRRSTASLDTSRRASRARSPTSRLGRLVAIIIALILPAQAAVDAAVVNVRSIAIVAIDSRDHVGARDVNVVKGAVARVLAVAVAAGAVHLADRVGPKVLYGYRARAVVLQDLVLGVAGAAAVYVGYARGRGALERGGVFADVGPPAILLQRSEQWFTIMERNRKGYVHVVQGAGTQAVDTLAIVRA